jgi:hypothetical protein
VGLREVREKAQEILHKPEQATGFYRIAYEKRGTPSMPRRSKLPPNKTIIEAVVDKALAEKLRSIAYEIYHGRRGALSYTVEEALETFIKLYENKQVSINPHNNIDAYWRQILEYIKKKHGDMLTPYEIIEPDLVEAITMTRGADKRTVKKYLETFLRLGYIKHVAGFSPKRVFKVQRDGPETP